MKVGDLICFKGGFPDPWSGKVGLVVDIDTRNLEILVLRGSIRRWMRRDSGKVINESR
jgi:hypothetical protein